MKSSRMPWPFLAAVLATTTFTLQAQIQFFKADNNDSLDLGSSWTNNLGVPPSGADTAIWDFNVATPANCTNIVGSPTWGGIQISNPSANVQVTSTGTLLLGGAGPNAIDLTGATRDLWLALSVTTSGDQNWVIPSGRTLAIGDASRNVRIQSNVGINGHLLYMRNVLVQAGGTLWLTNSATVVELGAATSTTVPIVVGNDGTASYAYQSAGTIKLRRTDGTTGSPKTALQVAGAGSSTAIYTMTGGAIQDASTLNTTTINVGDGSGANGTLNVDGTAAITIGSIRLANAANAVGTLNVTNGTVTVTGGSFDVGRTSSALPGPGTLNVYGGSVFSTNGMNVPHGQGPGFFNLYGGTVVLGNNLSVPDNTGTGAGTVNINGGVLTLTSGNINLPGTAGGTGTVNLNGGIVTVGSVLHPGTASGTLVLNGGTLRARANQAAFIANGVTANVGAGGALIDTANFTVTVPAPLLNGTGGGSDGGLTKLGSGTLLLSGANTYTGPTRVNAGALYLFTTNFPGGAITASNASVLHFIVGSAGSTLNCSSLSLGTLGASSGGTLTLEFDLNGFSNPTIPVVNTPGLSAAGAVNVNVTATGLDIGSYRLIQYAGNVGGSDFSFAANVLSGAVGYVTNNTATHSIDMVITRLPNLVWRAQVNTNWDTTTLNWVDLDNGLQTYYPNGASTLFDDSASNTTVYATAAFAPAALKIDNTSKNYTFTGIGRVTGVVGLTKQGAGTVTMALTNDYSGDTIISNGLFRLGASGVIPDGTGKGDVTLEGKLDLAGFSEAVNGLNGMGGTVDNSAGGSVALTVGNGGANSVFAGQITNSTGTLALTKAGNGSLVLLAKNGYSGGTTAGGILQLAYEESIGTGPLSLGGTLLWTDTAAHTLRNPLTITGGSTLGADTNGPLTVTVTANMAGSNRALTCNTDVLMANGVTNGGFSSKSGPGTLIIRNFAGPDWTGGTFGLNNGTFILDNASAIEHVNNIRIQCSVSGGTARLVLTNGASLTMMDSPTSNFRVGDLAASGTTNILDLAGVLTITPYSSPSTGDKFQMGGPGTTEIANLLPGGVLRARQIAKSSGSVSQTIFNFNGGTVSPNTNDFASTFMQGLDYCYVQDGGAVVDTAGWDVTISQQLQAGGTGGLTKQGAGTLTLNPDPYSFGLFNTYTGDTVVNGGTLVLGGGALAPSMNWVLSNGAALNASGIGMLTLTNAMGLKGDGTVLGYIYADAGSTIAPGTGMATLSFDNPPYLLGQLVMKVGKSGSTPVSDRLAVTSGGTLAYGGALTVTKAAGNLVTGDVFKLFDAGGYAGAFTSTNLPSGGVIWDLSGLYVDGTIRVASAPAPVEPKFNSPVLSGSNLILSGSGGSPNGTYYVVGSTNIALPLANWPRIATNSFDSGGEFRFTNSISTSIPKKFLSIEVP